MSNSSMTYRSARLLLGVAALGGIVQAAPAFADAPAVPPPAPAFSWTGIYVGANVGNTTAESTWSGPSGAGQFGGSDTDTLHSRGATYGGQIGYNYQSHALVVGLEASLHGTHQTSSNSYTGGEGYTGLTGIAARNTFGADVSARLGVALDRFLVFSKAGVAFERYHYAAMDDAAVTYQGADTRTGFLIGGGVEIGVTRNWSVKAEYNHVGFSTKTLTLTSAGSSNISIPIGGSHNTFLFGVNYRF